MAELEAQLHALKVERDALSIRAQTLAQCLAQKQQAAGGSGGSPTGSAAQDSGSAGPADTSVSLPNLLMSSVGLPWRSACRNGECRGNLS